MPVIFGQGAIAQPIDSERVEDQAARLGQCAFGHAHLPTYHFAYMRCHLIEVRFDMASRTDFSVKICYTIFPEIKHKLHHAHFAIFKPLFPAQGDFYLSPLAHDGNEALPEAWGWES